MQNDAEKVKIEYLTAGCNNETGVFDESEGFLIYGGGRNVLVSKIPSCENGTSVHPITCALSPAPMGRVHACQWIRLVNSLGALVAAEDGFLRYYHCNMNEVSPLSHTAWSLRFSFDLKSSVTLAAWTPTNLASTEAFLVAGTVKSEIYFIEADDKSQMIRSFAPKKLTALTIGLLPNSSDPFVLAALSDSTIRLLVRVSDACWNEELILSGHQNWITSLSVRTANESENDQVVNVLSSSLDKSIRVWKLRSSSTAAKLYELDELVPQKSSFSLKNKIYHVNSDSLALGHENAVYFARFLSTPLTPVTSTASLEILSGSSDRSLIVWGRGFGDAWRTILQLGDINGSLGSIGTDHTFAFYGGSVFNGRWVTAAASTGSILFWKRSDGESSEWIPQAPITGHSDRVESIAWAPIESKPTLFLVSTSKDQTTRIFAPLNTSTTTTHYNYREISRPQIHGYDLKCLAIYSISRGNTQRFELISGADEKIIRVFNAPRQFYNKLGLEIDESVPHSAQLPALGLSNKQIELSEGESENYYLNSSKTPENEGELVRNSLWPEVDKLYGHNQEISTLSLSPDRKFMASSAKSHLAADSALRLWQRENNEKWQCSFVIQAHNLTISCLVFSPNSLKLLSVSRDRNFCLIDPKNGSILSRHEGHSRHIFTADWLDNESFVTGSRDKSVKFWSIRESSSSESIDLQLILLQTISFENGITSLAIKNSFLAVGDEIGNIFIYKFISENNNWIESNFIKGGGGFGPADSITDLKWNFSVETPELAVASADNSIRILSFNL